MIASELVVFWTAFGAIGGTVAALATTAAVIVALWQTKYNNRKRIRISFSDNIFMMGLGRKYVGLTVTNIGNREIIIKNWGIKINKTQSMQVLTHLVGDTIDKGMTAELPHKLNIEESIDLTHRLELFEKAIEDVVADKKTKPNKRIVFYVTDSTGKQHLLKTKRKYKNYLFNNNSNVKGKHYA